MSHKNPGQCDNYDDFGSRCPESGVWYDEDAEMWFCQDCAEGYCLFEA